MQALGGGGGQSGGAVVQSTAPWAAMQAGELGANAAQEAAKLATDSINTAILNLNKQYQQASYTLQPYRASGVQALNKLNQYLGLGAYNPGAAPKAPTNDITQKQIDQYIKDNTTTISGGADNKYSYYDYTGVGADVGAAGKFENTHPGGTGPGLGAGNWVSGRTDLIGSPVSAFQNINPAIIDQLKQDNLPAFQQKMDEYNQNLNEYNSMLDSYNTTTAQGPMTQAQITENITNQPGFQAELTQGIDALSKSGASLGYLGSGRALKELMSFGQNKLSQYYGNTLSNLAGLAGQGQQAASTTAGLYANQGNNLASLYSSIGDAQANAALAAGQARSSALTNANQQFNVIGQQDTGSSLGGLGSLLSGGASLFGALGF